MSDFVRGTITLTSGATRVANLHRSGTVEFETPAGNRNGSDVWRDASAKQAATFVADAAEIDAAQLEANREHGERDAVVMTAAITEQTIEARKLGEIEAAELRQLDENEAAELRRLRSRYAGRSEELRAKPALVHTASCIDHAERCAWQNMTEAGEPFSSREELHEIALGYIESDLVSCECAERAKLVAKLDAGEFRLTRGTLRSYERRIAAIDDHAAECARRTAVPVEFHELPALLSDAVEIAHAYALAATFVDFECGTCGVDVNEPCRPWCSNAARQALYLPQQAEPVDVQSWLADLGEQCADCGAIGWHTATCPANAERADMEKLAELSVAELNELRDERRCGHCLYSLSAARHTAGTVEHATQAECDVLDAADREAAAAARREADAESAALRATVAARLRGEIVPAEPTAFVVRVELASGVDGAELAIILRELAAQLDGEPELRAFDGERLSDSNGNWIGDVQLEA